MNVLGSPLRVLREMFATTLLDFKSDNYVRSPPRPCHINLQIHVDDAMQRDKRAY